MVWLEVRILSGPPRSRMLPEISWRCTKGPELDRNCRHRSGAVTVGSIGWVARAASIRSPIDHTRSASKSPKAKKNGQIEQTRPDPCHPDHQDPVTSTQPETVGSSPHLDVPLAVLLLGA